MNGNGTKLQIWLLGALFSIALALSGANLAMTQSRLDRIEARQEAALDDRRAIEIRVADLNRQLSDRLSRIEGKIDNERTKK